MFIRRESFRQFLQFYPVTTSIIAINAFFFIIQFLPSIYQYVYVLGVGSNEAVFAGQYWCLVTSMFLHGSTMHFLFNSFALIIFAPALENILGKIKFTILYFLSGIFANIATLFLAQPFVSGLYGVSVGSFVFPQMDYLHLGASGAIYGLLGLYLFMTLFRKELMDPGSSQMVTTILIIGAVYTFVMPNINIYAHLFGFLGGFALGPIIITENVQPYSPIWRRTVARPRPGEEIEVAFDPQRWQKQKQRRKTLKFVIYGVFIVFIMIGLFFSLV